MVKVKEKLSFVEYLLYTRHYIKYLMLITFYRSHGKPVLGITLSTVQMRKPNIRAFGNVLVRGRARKSEARACVPGYTLRGFSTCSHRHHVLLWCMHECAQKIAYEKRRKKNACS